jgi:hypothetical protein
LEACARPNKVPKIRTGATGFIGSAIFKDLFAATQVLGLTRSDMALVTTHASVKSPRKHDPSYVSRLVDLGPMPCFKDMNNGIPGLGSHVLGDANMKIGVGLSPNE